MMELVGNLKPLLTQLYPGDAGQILDHLSVFDDGDVSDDWYKSLQLYSAYGDSFERGTHSVDHGAQGDFYSLAKKLPYIKMLGCNGVHVLPFLDSPMVDMGFDVSDFLHVRKELGGDDGLDSFMSKANELGLALFMDLVLNHVSVEHEWFRKAVAGDARYRDFFVWQAEAPELLRMEQREGAWWAKYSSMQKVGKNESFEVRVIFPERAGAIPHWFQAEDGNWFFHTFYPEQPDLNWQNSDVFEAMASVLHYWAEKGFHFRLDAVPYIGKDIGVGKTEGGSRVHTIIKALHAVVPKQVFLVEATESIARTVEYFGSTSGNEARLVYNFPLMNAMWGGLLTADSDLIWQSLEKLEVVPDWGRWVNFLRNHDDLMVRTGDDQQQKLIADQLTTKGAKFKLMAVAGRTASFLDEDEAHIVMAMLLLASMPGCPVIYYGDELGKKNTEVDLSSEDARMIHRGSLVEQDFDDGAKLYEQVAHIFNVRQEWAGRWQGFPRKLETKDEVWGGEYELRFKKFLIYINLSEKLQEVLVPGEDFESVLAVQGAEVQDGVIRLPRYGGIWGLQSRPSEG